MSDVRDTYRQAREETDAELAARMAALDDILAKEVRRLNRMSKLKALADSVKTGVADMEKQAEALTDRMVKLKDRGAVAFGKLHSELDGYEQAVVEAEQALAEQTNGGPPLGK